MDLHSLTRHIRLRYAQAPRLARWLAVARLRICPMDILLAEIPSGGALLDIGCGNGVFLSLAQEFRKVRQGIGCDISETALSVGRAANPDGAEFRLCLEFSEWPTGPFDTVSAIDVMHHIPPALQRAAFGEMARRVKPGGQLLYKDMCERPFWRAWANRLHDLVMARQWIHTVPIETVIEWGRADGLSVVRTARHDLYWYGHELVVFRRAA